MIIDVCTYNGEKDLWDIHYNVLKDYVDEFIVVEFDKTFSGKRKFPSFPLCYMGEPFPPRVKYHFIHEEEYEKYREMAGKSPNTQGAEHWKREFMQKESIKDTLIHLKDDDVVFIGDVDEIWEMPPVAISIPAKLKHRVYAYYLNNHSSEEFYGTLASMYGCIKNACLNHVRSTRHLKINEYAGWHFTSMGGYEAVKKKLDDSYTEETYNSPEVQRQLKDNVENLKDFLGRPFTYKIDESEWPQYLKDNKDKYQHLMK